MGTFESPTTQEGVPLLSAKHIGDYKLIWDDFKFVSTDFASQSRKRCGAEKGDILIVGREVALVGLLFVMSRESFV
jgi:uncharacterized protein (UPF0212 family)